MSLLLAMALAQSCQVYTARCDCFPAVPFEGHKLFIVETCDGKEEWTADYYAPTFDTDEECLIAAKTHPVCIDLQKPSHDK